MREMKASGFFPVGSAGLSEPYDSTSRGPADRCLKRKLADGSGQPSLPIEENAARQSHE